MAQQLINVGTSANSGGGDPLRAAMIKINENFAEVYASLVLLEDGNITSDLKGSVYADDSTLLVDAVSGTIPGYISIADLQSIAAGSADFNAFKAAIAAL